VYQWSVDQLSRLVQPDASNLTEDNYMSNAEGDESGFGKGLFGGGGAHRPVQKLHDGYT
jgi:hypothetical protein